jgi:hypothetical protein
LRFGTGAARPKTKTKDADDGKDNAGLDIHGTNSKEVCAGHKTVFQENRTADGVSIPAKFNTAYPPNIIVLKAV